jgi:hypothetical protein
MFAITVATLAFISGCTPAAEVDQQDEDFIGWQGEKCVDTCEPAFQKNCNAVKLELRASCLVRC